MHRITVIGTPGTGKTTLAQQLAARLGYPFIELDALFWEPNWTPVATPIFRERVTQALAGAAWTTGGNYSVARDLIWQRSDTVIWLDSVRNDTPGRTFIGAALIARLPAGAVLDGPADGRCQVEADGSLTCALTGFETGVAQGFRFAVKLTSAGVAAASFELNAVYTEGAGPQQTLRLTTRANTTVHAAGGALPDCGYPNLPFVRDLLARRAPQTRLVQVAPAIYEPPGGAIQSYRHVLTADDGPGRLVDDLTTVVVLQRVASAVTLTLFFPGPPGNTYRVLAFDEQGQLLALTRTDQLMIPGEYTLALHGLPRPVKRVVIQNLVYGDYDASSVRSSGGVYLAVVELFFATP